VKEWDTELILEKSPDAVGKITRVDELEKTALKKKSLFISPFE
jgi:hypothetical protein